MTQIDNFANQPGKEHRKKLDFRNVARSYCHKRDISSALYFLYLLGLIRIIMKAPFFIIALCLMSLSGITQSATNFKCNDCLSRTHELFSELDSGYVIVLCWVMPCGTCIGPALSAYNVVNSFQTTNPNRVLFYLIDDYADTNCKSLDSWANSNGIPQSSFSQRFSNALIKMSHYGTDGMPKLVVIGGSGHTVFFNANNTINVVNFKKAIDAALSVTAIDEFKKIINDFSVTPNPLTGQSATIKLHLTESSDIRLQMYNLEGNLVKKLYSGKMNSGDNQLQINTAGLTSGMYLLKLRAGTYESSLNIIIP